MRSRIAISSVVPGFFVFVHMAITNFVNWCPSWCPFCHSSTACAICQYRHTLTLIVYSWP
jgi:hypothetical protein